MTLILTMAGKYSRFHKEGYNIPKYLLPWGNKTILSEIICELNKKNIFENIFLIANSNDSLYFPHIKEIIKYYSIPSENLLITDDTSGQAETAFKSLNNIKNKINENEESILFHNIDTILYKRDFTFLEKSLKEFDGYIDVFNSNNHEYSYILEEQNIVKSISEKILVSNIATSGFYGFKNIKTFFDFYNIEDIYISDIYTKMIHHKKNIIISEIHNEKNTIVLGTPNEYIKYTSIINSLLKDLKNEKYIY